MNSEAVKPPKFQKQKSERQMSCLIKVRYITHNALILLLFIYFMSMMRAYSNFYTSKSKGNVTTVDKLLLTQRKQIKSTPFCPTGMFFFSNFYFGNVNLFINSYYVPNFIKKLLLESGFSNFRQNRNDVKQRLVIWPPF